MSMPHDIIHCTGCGGAWATSRLWGSYRYRLADGRELWIERVLAWCTPCAGLEPVEVLPEREKLLAELAQVRRRLRKRRAPFHLRALGWILAKALPPYCRFMDKAAEQCDTLEATLAWCDSRRSPPRCLTCGATESEPFDRKALEAGLRLRHPGCSGRLAMRRSPIQFASGRQSRFYDAEGRFIEIRER